MFRRFGVLLLSVVLMSVIAGIMVIDAFAAKAYDPNCWGEVTSQFASGPGNLGEHASAQEEPRQGVGNVAKTDVAPGDHVSDHGRLVGPFFGSNCEDGPETG